MLSAALPYRSPRSRADKPQMNSAEDFISFVLALPLPTWDALARGACCWGDAGRPLRSCGTVSTHGSKIARSLLGIRAPRWSTAPPSRHLAARAQRLPGRPVAKPRGRLGKNPSRGLSHRRCEEAGTWCCVCRPGYRRRRPRAAHPLPLGLWQPWQGCAEGLPQERTAAATARYLQERNDDG